MHVHNISLQPVGFKKWFDFDMIYILIANKDNFVCSSNVKVIKTLVCYDICLVCDRLKTKKTDKCIFYVACA